MIEMSPTDLRLHSLPTPTAKNPGLEVHGGIVSLRLLRYLADVLAIGGCNKGRRNM